MVTPGQRLLATLVVAVSLAACAGNSGGALPPASQVAAAFASAARPGAVPPACKNQSTTTEFASSTGTFSSKAGALCIPEFEGLGGTLERPAAKPPVGVQATSSTTNYDDSLPELGKGKALFYLQLGTSGATTFGKKLLAGGGLKGKTLKAGTAYTVYGEAKISGGVAGITIPFKPCRVTATSGKYGGVLSRLGILLTGQEIGGPATIYIEVYSRSKISAKC